MIKVSIIVPVYKVEPYVRRCIESVLQQVTDKFDIECVVVNDCTPDRSMDIAREVVAEHSSDKGISFVMIDHKENLGLSCARNTGIDAAHGEWVMFLDSDDYLKPDSIAYMMDAWERHPEADLVIGNHYDCKTNRSMVGQTDEVLLDHESACRWLYESSHTAWNKLVRRQLLLHNQLYFEPGIIFEDVPWSYQVHEKINKVLILPRVTYMYEYVPTSIINSNQKAKKNVESIVVSFDTLLFHPYPQSLYVPQRIDVFFHLLKAVVIENQSPLPADLRQILSRCKQSLMRDVLKHGRLILTFFFLLMYAPFRYLLRIKKVRWNLFRLKRFFSMVASSFNWLH